MNKIYFSDLTRKEEKKILVWCRTNLSSDFYFNSISLPCEEPIEGTIAGDADNCACFYDCLYLRSEEDKIKFILKWL